MPSPGAADPHRNQQNRNERDAEGGGKDRVYKLSREECYLLQTFIKTLFPARGPEGTDPAHCGCCALRVKERA